jgi:hypothetical protein
VLMCVNAQPLATMEANKPVSIVVQDNYTLKRELTPSSLVTRPEPPPPRPIALG